MTTENVTEILDHCRKNGTRVTLSYAGDDGIDWLEEFDTTGRVGLSCGPMQVPILLANSRSLGGGAILVQRVARIRESRGGRELYRRENYRQPTLTVRRGGVAGLPVEVWNGDRVHRRFRSERAMLAWARRLGVAMLVYKRDDASPE